MIGPDMPLLDECVARAKFVAAQQLYEIRGMFRGRGILIEPPEFPTLIVRFSGPDRIVRAGVQLQLRNYDFLPPSVTFLTAEGEPHTDLSLGIELRPSVESHVPPAVKDGMMMVADNGGYLPGNHPFTGRPFLCVRGTWEFHQHPQHADVLWEWIRCESGYGLQYVIEQAHNAFRPDLFA